jgi:hypothetical protein
MHLSPNELEPFVPWLKTFPKKVADRVTTYLWPLGSAVITIGLIEYVDYVDRAEDYEHRF